MKHAVTVAILCLCGAISVPGEQTDRLVFRRCGFSIAPLDEPGEGIDVVAMWLPAFGGGEFPSWVTVSTQAYQGSIEKFPAVYLKQWAKHTQGVRHIMLTERKVAKDTIVFEFSRGGPILTSRYYVKAIVRSGTACVAKAMVEQDEWELVSAKVKACVDSLDLFLSGAVSFPGERTDRLVFRRCGLSIAPLDEPGEGISLVRMSLPPSGGAKSPAMVMVSTQAYQGSIEKLPAVYLKEWAAKHTSGIRHIMLTERKVAKDTIVFEFSGEGGDLTFRHYAKAIVRSGTACVAHATVEQGQWELVSAKLKACVDSLETIEPKEGPQGSTRPSPAPRGLR